MRKFTRYLACLALVLMSACGGGGGGGTSGTPQTNASPLPPPPAVPVPLPEVRLTTITLQSDAGDSIGLGKNYAYNLTNAKISVTSAKNQLMVEIEGDETWYGVFQTGGDDQSELKTGMVSNAQRYEDGQPASTSGLSWSGNGRYCTTSNGWFAIDNVKYSGAVLQEITVRFERHCNGAAASLHGEIKYYADDTSKPPPPVLPVPATLWHPPADLAGTSGNYAYFESEDGDYVGAGKTYRYDQHSANIIAGGDVYNLAIEVEGNEHWTAELRGMTFLQTIAAGYYPGVHGSRFDNPVKGGLSWKGMGRGCISSSGWFAIDAVTQDLDGNVTSLDLRFEQHCEGRSAALRGAIHWAAPGKAILPAAVNTAPGSWRAPAASLPATGNYLYVQSDAGEALANGLVDLQTSATAQFTASTQDNALAFSTHGVHQWFGNFITGQGQSQFTAGTYPNMNGSSLDPGATGSISVGGDSHVNLPSQGWLVIDNINYVDGKLAAVDLRFEQLGRTDAGLLHGQLHWRANQPDTFPGPVLPAPSLFWHPAAGATPTGGNYIYLESDRSDFIGYQQAYLYTPLDSLIGVRNNGNGVTVEVRGDTSWDGRFIPMSNLSQIQPGYYASLESSTFGNPARGNFSWSGDGRGCDALSGVVVDKADYANGQLVELQLRFEQHCNESPGGLRGEIHWSANDTRQPAGPANPMPAGLWTAPAGALPASGNYLYVQSDPRDPIGQGKTWLMTAQDTAFFANTTTMAYPEATFNFTANSSKKEVGNWSGSLQAMIGLNHFQVGFYNWTLRYPFQNRAFGGLEWGANGVGCNLSVGWFAIDKASYVGDTLVALHARFEHHCEYLSDALRGELNWEAPPATLATAGRVRTSAMQGADRSRQLSEEIMNTRRSRGPQKQTRK